MNGGFTNKMKDYTLKQVSSLMKNSRQAVYALTKHNRLKSIQKGRIIYVSDCNLIEYCKMRIQELDTERKELADLVNYLQ